MGNRTLITYLHANNKQASINPLLFIDSIKFNIYYSIFDAPILKYGKTTATCFLVCKPNALSRHTSELLNGARTKKTNKSLRTMRSVKPHWFALFGFHSLKPYRTYLDRYVQNSNPSIFCFCYFRLAVESYWCSNPQVILYEFKNVVE